MYNIIAQGLGTIAIILGLFVYQFKTPKGILTMKLVANLFWTVHYIMIGAVTAFATALVCDIREPVYAYEKDDKKRFVWLIIFVILCVVSICVTWQGPTSILPGAATILATYSFYQKEVKNMRTIALIYTILLLVYDISVRSYPGILCQILSLGSILIAIFRFRKQKEKVAENDL